MVDGAGSMADAAATSFGPVAVGHDGGGDDAAWSIGPESTEPRPVPDVDDLGSVASIGDSITIAGYHGALWFWKGSEWVRVDLDLPFEMNVRSLDGDGPRWVAAGDDGQMIQVWSGDIP